MQEDVKKEFEAVFWQKLSDATGWSVELLKRAENAEVITPRQVIEMFSTLIQEGFDKITNSSVPSCPHCGSEHETVRGSRGDCNCLNCGKSWVISPID